MKKSDLRTGMLVETKSEGIYIVLKNVETSVYGTQDLFFASERSFTTGKYYNDDLTRTTGSNNEYDIIKVYSKRSDSHMLQLSKEGRNLVWEREKPTIEISSTEAFEILKKHFGCDVKICEVDQ
jgi:hypothetical protein